MQRRKDRGIDGRGSDFRSGAIERRNVLDCQAKLLDAVMDGRHEMFADIIQIIFRSFYCCPVVLFGSFNRSFGGKGRRALLSISSMRVRRRRSSLG
jgi:hypothetical protein